MSPITNGRAGRSAILPSGTMPHTRRFGIVSSTNGFDGFVAEREVRESDRADLRKRLSAGAERELPWLVDIPAARHDAGDCIGRDRRWVAFDRVAHHRRPWRRRWRR